MTVRKSEKRLPANRFAALLSDIKGRIQTSQTRAMLAVNAELVRLYWDIGRMIAGRQKSEGWGASVIPRLAVELRNELPELKGFSERNIGRMIAFYREYPDPASILQPVVEHMQPQTILPQAAAKSDESLLWLIPWFHHVLLMEKIKNFSDRKWYMEQTLSNGWSRNILAMQIDAQAHRRQGKIVSNFAALLPAAQSDLVQQTLKDPYIFDFLTLTETFQERDLETQLVVHLEKFLLELGQGFAFVGRQYRVEAGDEDFYIDLLFYHLKMRAFVVIDLKKGKFKPEYAGKLNFYCNIINNKLKHPQDQPTIGLILCQSQDKLQAEYSLSGIDKPIGIATYQLTRALPRQLRSMLPTVEQIEAELQQTLKPAQKPPSKSARKVQCRQKRKKSRR